MFISQEEKEDIYDCLRMLGLKVSDVREDLVEGARVVSKNATIANEFQDQIARVVDLLQKEQQVFNDQVSAEFQAANSCYSDLRALVEAMRWDNECRWNELYSYLGVSREVREDGSCRLKGCLNLPTGFREMTSKDLSYYLPTPGLPLLPKKKGRNKDGSLDMRSVNRVVRKVKRDLEKTKKGASK